MALSPKDYTEDPCYYAQFRDDEGEYTLTHWKILALKLTFVIAFEHFVFGIGRCIDLIVPDIPETLQIKIKREQYLAKQILSLSAENQNFPPTTSATSDFD
jgi:anoctamin-7